MEAKGFTLRPLTSSDAEEAAVLSGQLGYPCDVAEMRGRIEQLAGSDERIVLAAILDGQIAGWADASVERHLQAPDVVVLNGLVVREGLRGQNIGRQLCQAIEAWAQRCGVAAVRVHSQIKREDAHRFYLRDGYEHVKTSAVFEKKLR